MSVLTEVPIKLVLKIKQLKNLLSFDEVALMLTNSMFESALYLNIHINDALNADTERQAVTSLARAYQKLGSLRYYFDILSDTQYLSGGVAHGFFSDFDLIERRLNQALDGYEGIIDDLPGDGYYDRLQLFTDDE